MPTNPIGPGTRNLCVNVRQSVHRTLGRLAHVRDESMGAFVRRLLGVAPAIARSPFAAERAALADAEAAQILREAAADGVGPEDSPAIAKAIRLIESSAEDDRQLAFTFSRLSA